MKKILVVLAAAVLVLSFAGAAFAIHAEIPAETQAVVAKSSTQITLGGEIRVRGWYTKNLGDAQVYNTDHYNATAGYNTLTANWLFDNSVNAYVWAANQYNVFTPGTAAHNTRFNKTGIAKTGIESNSKAWYDQRIRLFVDAKVSDNVQGFVQLETGTADQLGKGNGPTTTADKYFWGNFNSKPNTSLGILEAWILYKGTGLFGFNSGLKIGHMPLKLSEGQFFDHTQLGDDAIVFFMDPTKQLHIGLLTIKFAGDEGQPLTVPLLGLDNATGKRSDNTDDLDGYVALMTYKINDKNTVGINYTYLNQSDLGFSHQNVGVHANGSFGNFGYAAEVDFQFGKVYDGTPAESSFKGEAVMLMGNYRMGGLNLRGKFAYGSGDDDSDDDIDTFIPYLGTVQNIALIYEYLATTTAGSTGTGLANTTVYQLGLDYAATKDLSFSGDLLFYRASKAGHNISKDAGWEFDAKMVYKIAKNLTYQIDAGYFDPGSFYEDTLHQIAKEWALPNTIKIDHDDTKGITVIRNMLTLSF